MNGFGHIEIPTTDFKKAKRFFGKVFAWEFQDIPEVDYVLFRAGRHPNGGFMLVKKMPKTGQVNAYIEVEDIDSKLKEIRKAKGKVLLKKSPVGSSGYCAQFSTPDGCKLWLWESTPKEDAAMESSPQS
jgi:predicted enzyme related to lactoylglutathione lyase